MAGSRQYSERCICGAEITLSENFEFMSSRETREIYNNWKQEHKNCLTLFHQIQRVRAKQLVRANPKLLG